MAITKERALLELSMLNAEADPPKGNEGVTFADIVADLLDKGLPQEVVTRLRPVWDSTRQVAGELIHIGKIIVLKIVEFVRANRHLAVGVAVGAAIGALANLIPWFGSFLATITVPVGALIGAALGQRMDQGQNVNPIVEGAISLAMKFFELLASILTGVWDEWQRA